jgi:hypothetical protein
LPSSHGDSNKESDIYDGRDEIGEISRGQNGTRKGQKEVRVEFEEMREESSQTKRGNLYNLSAECCKATSSRSET